MGMFNKAHETSTTSVDAEALRQRRTMGEGEEELPVRFAVVMRAVETLCRAETWSLGGLNCKRAAREPRVGAGPRCIADVSSAAGPHRRRRGSSEHDHQRARKGGTDDFPAGQSGKARSMTDRTNGLLSRPQAFLGLRLNP